nr:MAG TPA: hypothetical protein [Caudoviricetes sp.]
MAKKEKFVLVPISMFFLVCANVSCSSNNDTEDERAKLENTSWTSDDVATHSSALVAVDKTEPNTTIQSKMRQVVGLNYTEETKSEEGYWFWDLCKQAGHENDSVMTASFSPDKCTFKVKVTRARAKANQTKTESLYKFDEGSYVVRFGSNRYEEITVYSYGVYRADGTLFIPLDGKGCVAYQTKYTYANKEVFSEDVDEYYVTASYEVANNVITFSYIKDGKTITFDGLLSTDGNRITITNNPVVNSVTALKK